MDLTEKEVKANYIFKGKILNLRVDDVSLPDGSMAKREYCEHLGGASVLPVDSDGYVYLVKQYRYAYREELLEIPAGKLELGEEPIDTAIRELGEETGLSGKVTEFGILYPTPAYTNEPLMIFLATDLVKKEKQHLDSDEFLDVVKLPFSEVLNMVLSGEIKDAKTCYAVLKYAYLSVKH